MKKFSHWIAKIDMPRIPKGSKIDPTYHMGGDQKPEDFPDAIEAVYRELDEEQSGWEDLFEELFLGEAQFESKEDRVDRLRKKYKLTKIQA